MTDSETAGSAASTDGTVLEDVVPAVGHFLGYCVYALLAAVPLLVAFLVSGLLAEAVRVVAATAGLPAGSPFGEGPGYTYDVAFVLVGVPIVGALWWWLDSFYFGSETEVFGHRLRSADRSALVQSLPPAVSVLAAWSLPATVGWSVWTTLTIAIVHLAVALHVAEYGWAARPLGLVGAWRYVFLGAAGLPVSFVAAILLLTIGGTLPSTAAHVSTGRVAADGPVLAVGPVAVGAWLVGLLLTQLAVAGGYLLVQRGLRTVIRGLGRDGDADGPVPGLTSLLFGTEPTPGAPEWYPTNDRVDAGDEPSDDGLIRDLPEDRERTPEAEAVLAGDGSPGGLDASERKYADDEAERKHRAAKRREAPVEKGEVVELSLLEVEYHPNSYTIRGKVEDFNVFLDENVPDGLEEYDVVRAKILYFNSERTSATAAYLGDA